jgi:DNA-binding MarR family transcriptional regulator
MTMKLNTASKLILRCLSSTQPQTLENLMVQTGLSVQYVFVTLSNLSKHGLVVKQRLREVTTYVLADSSHPAARDTLTVLLPSVTTDLPA